MEEKIRTLTHSSDVNSIFKGNDFYYSDKKIVLNKYGTPLIKIEDFKPSQPQAKTFQQLHFNLQMQSKRAELKQKILKSTQGLSPISKRKVERRDEASQISPLFKKPREPDEEGLDEICNLETPYYLNRRKAFEKKSQQSQKVISKNYARHLSTVVDFQKVANAIQSTLGTNQKKTSPKKKIIFSNDLHKSKSETIKVRKHNRKKDDAKTKISLYDLEKNFMHMQRQTIESYLKGQKVDQEIINKDFMSYILETFEEKAKEKYKLRKKIEMFQEIEHSFQGKRLSFLLNRPSSSNLDRKKILSSRPISAITSNLMSQSQTNLTKKIPLHHLSVKEEKKKQKIEENKKTIVKVKESMFSDLEGLGEVERKALTKLRKKFVLYNNTNYEVLDHDKMNFLHRKNDLKTKNLLVLDSEKFRKSRASPTKIIIGNENTKSQFLYYQSVLTASLRYPMQLDEEKALESREKREKEESLRIVEEEQKAKNKLAEQEKHLLDLKQFKKKMEIKPLNEEELDFFQKIKKNQENAVYFALLAKPYLVNIVDKLNQTPLHLAAKRGLYEMACLFCEFNPNFQAKDILDRTPLELAGANGHANICKLIDSKQYIQKSPSRAINNVKKL